VKAWWLPPLEGKQLLELDSRGQSCWVTGCLSTASGLDQGMLGSL
jgi:hypothetical protein